VADLPELEAAMASQRFRTIRDLPDEALLSFARSVGTGQARDAVEELYRRYEPLVLAAAGRISAERSAEDRADARQGAALGLIEAIRSYDPGHGAPFAAFCQSHVRGGAIRAVHGSARPDRPGGSYRSLRDESLDGLIADQGDALWFPSAMAASDPAEVAAERDRIRRALTPLSPLDAAVLFESAVLDLPKQDVADRMGVTPQAVSNRLRRIRQRLN
jgi:RNA polymerase sigma factor (sigma-70 family)